MQTVCTRISHSHGRLNGPGKAMFYSGIHDNFTEEMRKYISASSEDTESEPGIRLIVA